jgi:putative membrane protein insertion efficiency factor
MPIALAIIRFYRRWISPLFAPRCRFEPTCSAYSYEAIVRHVLFRGVALAMWRLLKCQPFHRGGFDPLR